MYKTRIQITEYENGKKEYVPSVKILDNWYSLCSYLFGYNKNGKEYVDSQEQAQIICNSFLKSCEKPTIKSISYIDNE